MCCRLKLSVTLCLAALLTLSCGGKEEFNPEAQGEAFDDGINDEGEGGMEPLAGENGIFHAPFPEDTVDRIPDFSRVGYKYSDVPIPDLPVAAVISPSSVAAALQSGICADTTAYIQSVIDRVGGSGGGAVYIEDGYYHVSRILFIDYDNTVVRGQSTSGTVIIADGTDQRCVFALGKSRAFQGEETDIYKDVSGRWCRISTTIAAGPEGASSFGSYFIRQLLPLAASRILYECTPVAEDYVPVGRLYLDVRNPRLFSPGEEVVIQRPVSAAWISDIGMDKIADNGRTGASVTKQWNTWTSTMCWTRTIVSIDGNRLYFDAPVVQALDANYGGGLVYKCSTDRISGSGVEDLTIESAYDPSKGKASYGYYDEDHAWNGVRVYSAKDCWVRRVDSRYLGMSLVSIGTFALRTTVEDCFSDMPISVISGARRYAFFIGGGELSLVRNCSCNEDRHCFVVNSSYNPGPNTFTSCTASNVYDAIGTHMCWGTGTLYDRIKVTSVAGSSSARGQVAAQDRGNSGNGHGWTSANDVFWNPEARSVVCFSPWAKENTPALDFRSSRSSGRNYAIGAVGEKARGFDESLSQDYYGNPVTDWYRDVLGYELRPDGQWYPQVGYDQSGTRHVYLPDSYGAETFSWWPELTQEAYSDPLSLYQCQLEDRHARGIYLNAL